MLDQTDRNSDSKAWIGSDQYLILLDRDPGFIILDRIMILSPESDRIGILFCRIVQPWPKFFFRRVVTHVEETHMESHKKI